ncbi:MAG: hypothetical protein NZ903_03330, partial [Candidatus Micrarchaeota archaeon]|nr:hypothetical protein [Candidatus Micrarchaeota archaeon]
SNLTIYYYNTTTKSWRAKLNITSISGLRGTGIESGRSYGWYNTSEGVIINLNETISSSAPFLYVPGVYKVVINSYDPAATTGSKMHSAWKYFVIYTVPGCPGKV